ncbi:MAG: STAS domain-containing protein [Lachnospiraceae bacterium]|nr:STAS domain-containing protein [Lachnospiraceae bacterium]
MLQIVTEQSENQTTLYLKGRMDLGGARSASGPFMEQADQAMKIVLDCSELEYVASAGLRVLKQLHQTMKDKGGNLILKGIRPDVMDILEMTGFDAMLVIEQ